MRLIKSDPTKVVAKEIEDSVEEGAPEIKFVDIEKLKALLPTQSDAQIARALHCHPALVKSLRLRLVGCKPAECGISWDELRAA